MPDSESLLVAQRFAAVYKRGLRIAQQIPDTDPNDFALGYAIAANAQQLTIRLRDAAEIRDVAASHAVISFNDYAAGYELAIADCVATPGIAVHRGL